MSEEIEIDDLLLSDKEEDTNKNEKKFHKEKKNLSIIGGGDIDKESGNLNDNDDKIDKIKNNNPLDNIIKKGEEKNKVLPKFNNNNNNNNNNIFSDFVFGNVIQLNNNSNQNNNSNNQNEIQNNQSYLNNNINIQKNKNQIPSSILSSQSLDKKTINKNLDSSSQLNKNEAINNNNIYNNIPIQSQIKKDKETFGTKTSYLNEQNSYSILQEQIQRYERQKEEIKEKYRKTLDEKENEFRDLRADYKDEIEKFERKCDLKIKTQKEYLKDEEAKINEQKEKIEKDKINKINDLEEIYKKKLEKDSNFIEQKNKIELKKIEKENKIELDKIEKDIEKFREKNEELKKNEKSYKMESIYEEVVAKLNMEKNGIELKKDYNNQKFLVNLNEDKKQELEEKKRTIEQTIEKYKEEILKLKKEHDDESFKLKKELYNIKKKENDINNQKLEDEKEYKQKIFEIEMSQKNLESKTEEENNLRNLEQELDGKMDMLYKEKDIFEKEKNKIMRVLKERNDEIKKKAELINEEELDLEKELNQVLAEEMEINNHLNNIKYTEQNIELERMNIEKEKKNLELMEKRVEDEISNLNQGKAKMEEDKETIKNIIFNIEQKNNEIDNEYKSLQRESRGLDFKEKAIENMRINNVLKNQYANDFNNNIEVMGFNSSPNFGNYKKPNSQNFQNTKIYRDNFRMNETEKFNADEYFKKLQESLNEKKFVRNIDPNEEIDNFLMNGKNYVRDIRDKINGLENEKV